MAAKSKNVEMCSGPLFKNIWKFAFPFMITAVLQHFYHAADTIVVGRYAGHEALAGVGSTGSLVALILNLFIGLSAGVSVTIGQAMGAKKEMEVSKIVHTAILLAIVCGIFITITGVVFAEFFLNLTGVPDDVIPYAKSYMQVSFLGKTFVLIYNFGSAILRAKGDTKRPLYIVSISGIVNIVLNLFFVIVLKMASAGVALATVISQIINASSILIILLKESDSTRIYINKLKIHASHLKNILRIGIPSGIQSSIFSFSNVIVQSSVNSFGSAAIAGSSAAQSIGAFINTALNAFYQTSLAFVSQNVGAKNYKRLNKVIVYCLLSVCMVWVIMSSLLLIFGKALLGIYAPDDLEVIKWGLIRLNVVGCTYGLCGCMNVLSGALRGIGYSFLGMISSIVGVCGIRIVWIFTVFRYFRSFEMLFVSFPLSWFGTFIFHTTLYIILKKRLELKDKNTIET